MFAVKSTDHSDWLIKLLRKQFDVMRFLLAWYLLGTNNKTMIQLIISDTKYHVNGDGSDSRRTPVDVHCKGIFI